MSYIEQAKINKVNAQKAAAFDDIRRGQQEQSVYDQGSNDAIMEIERQLQERMAQEQAFRAEQAAAEAAFARANEPASTPSFSRYMKDVAQYLQDKSTTAADGLANSFAGPVRQMPMSNTNDQYGQ